MDWFNLFCWYRMLDGEFCVKVGWRYSLNKDMIFVKSTEAWGSVGSRRQGIPFV